MLYDNHDNHKGLFLSSVGIPHSEPKNPDPGPKFFENAGSGSVKTGALFMCQSSEYII
jgi:hypothetical protein